MMDEYVVVFYKVIQSKENFVGDLDWFNYLDGEREKISLNSLDGVKTKLKFREKDGYVYSVLTPYNKEGTLKELQRIFQGNYVIFLEFFRSGVLDVDGYEDEECQRNFSLFFDIFSYGLLCQFFKEYSVDNKKKSVISRALFGRVSKGIR